MEPSGGGKPKGWNLPGGKSPRGGNLPGKRTRGGTQAWKLPGGNGPSTKIKDPTNSAFTMNVVIVKNTKTQLFSCRHEEDKCVMYSIL